MLCGISRRVLFQEGAALRRCLPPPTRSRRVLAHHHHIRRNQSSSCGTGATTEEETKRHQSHNELIQEEFTKQATSYASNPTIIDRGWAMRLVDAVDPEPNDKVLEVATGPGYVALSFGSVVGKAVGLDITEAALANARRNRAEMGIDNVEFVAGDANSLPFQDGEFDVAVCRLAFHHFESPQRVLSEMTRVVRRGGKVAVEDMISSEIDHRASYYNEWERLRDPSHTEALSAGRLFGMLGECGLEMETVRSEHRKQDVETWLDNAQARDGTADGVRRMILADAEEGISGTPVFTDGDGRLCFMHRMLTVVALKL